MGLVAVLRDAGIQVDTCDGDNYTDGMQYTVVSTGSDADMRRAVAVAIRAGYCPTAMSGFWDLDDTGNVSGE